MFFPAQFMEILGLHWFRWPGNQIEDPNGMYQFLECEYMKGDEYDEMIFDPTHFMLTKWLPRSFAHLQGLKKLYFRNAMWLGFIGTFANFADPEVVDSFERSLKAAKVFSGWFDFLGGYRTKMEEKMGIPLAHTSFAFAPFDMIGDTMRGTVPILEDIHGQPDKLLALIDKVTEFAIEDQI
jgi:hypothetical protein